MKLKMLDNMPEGILGFELSGRLHAEDYREDILPMLHQHVERHGGIRLLCVVGNDFQGANLGAVIQGLAGVHYFTRMVAVAVVSDNPRIRGVTRLSRLLSPWPCRLFRTKEMEQAKEWAAKGQELHCTLEEKNGILTVRPQAPLAPEPLAQLTLMMEEYCAQHGPLAGLIVDTRRFPFWQGIGGLRGHLAFICRQRKKVRKVALVTDSPLARGAEILAPFLLSLRVRHFPHGEIEAAREWILAKIEQ